MITREELQSANHCSRSRKIIEIYHKKKYGRSSVVTIQKFLYAIDNGDIEQINAVLPDDCYMGKWEAIDSAPRDGTMFLLSFPKQMNLIVRCKYSTIHKYFSTDHETRGIIRQTVLHSDQKWTPLPTPPKEMK